MKTFGSLQTYPNPLAEERGLPCTCDGRRDGGPTWRRWKIQSRYRTIVRTLIKFNIRSSPQPSASAIAHRRSGTAPRARRPRRPGLFAFVFPLSALPLPARSKARLSAALRQAQKSDVGMSEGRDVTSDPIRSTRSFSTLLSESIPFHTPSPSSRPLRSSPRRETR
jgi:hypothetical protein